jgi:hypothetical protein
LNYLPGVSASPEDVFHAVRAAGRIGFYDDAHSAFVDLVGLIA